MTTRRDVLKAAPAVLAVAAIPLAAVAAVGATDPIFALIEDHRAAWDAYNAVVKTEGRLDEELPWARKKTTYHWTGEGWDLTCDNPDDDPRWRQFWRDYIAASGRTAAAAEALVGTEPTTIAGIIALASYAVGYVRRGECWPDNEWDFEDGGKNARTVTFETVLLANIADSLRRVSGAQA